MGARGIGTALLVALGLACSTPAPVEEAAPTPGEGTGDSSFVVCKDPRPQACTQEMRPVCAHTMNGLLETRSNACAACSDANILGYRAGACG